MKILSRIHSLQSVWKSIALAGLALAVTTTAQAGLVVYEGFNYAGQSDNAALGAAAFNGGTGLSSNWQGAGKYRSTGLTFSDLAVAGGCAQNGNSQIYYRPLNLSKTGTIWGSFLFQSVGVVDSTTTLLSYVVSKETNGTDWQVTTNFGVTPKSYNQTIVSFGPGATIGPVTASAAAISWTVPYGTNVTTLAPTYTLSTGATCNKASGSTQDFTSPVHYIVQASDFATSGTTTDYTVTVTVAPASSAKDILTCDFGVLGPAVIAGTNITLFVSPSQAVTNLAPTFTLSPQATINPVSGTARNFTTPQTYTVTAQNGTTQAYTVAVQSYATWTNSASFFILTTPEGANIPTGAAEINFPVLLRLNSGNFNFTQAQSDGRDIRFTTLSGIPLSYQIEQWDAVAGTTAVWIKIPSISANASQEIIMYWGKTGVVAESSGPNVFKNWWGGISSSCQSSKSEAARCFRTGAFAKALSPHTAQRKF